MDIVKLIKSSFEDYDSIASSSWLHMIVWDLTTEIYLYICVGILTCIVIGWYVYYRQCKRKYELEMLRLAENVDSTAADLRGLRFRKRDKMLFYGRRMLRKVKNVSGQVYGGQGRKRKAVMRFAKRILQLRRDNIPLQLKTVEPPAEYMQETVEGSDRVPPDALYMLQSIRIFGHFEKPIFLKLCKHTEVLKLEPGDYLFQITDADDSVFIVQSGLIHVYISNADGSMLSLKTVKKGESVTSLLSFVDVLSGNPSYYKTVTAKAVESSIVIRLPMHAFDEVFNENSDIMFRVIQVIMIRLQRVLFTALRNYLGLNSELVQNHMRPKKSRTDAAHMSISQGKTASPGHRRSNSEHFQHTLSDVHMPSMSHVTIAQQPDMLVDINTEARTAESSGQVSTTVHPQVSTKPPPHPLHHASIVGNLSTRRVSVAPPEMQINAGQIDEKLVHVLAVDSFLHELGLPEDDRSLLSPFVKVQMVEKDDVLITEGNSEDICVWFVMSGGLSVYQTGMETIGSKKVETDVFIHNVNPGEVVGALAVLTGEGSAYKIVSVVPSRVAFIRRIDIYEIMRQRPRIVLDLGNGVVRRLSPLVRQCDYALDWIFLEAGRAVYRQEENSDSTYIALSGRLRSVITHPTGKKEIVGEYGKGDLVGIVEMITETTRTTTVMAVRDSELAKLPDGLFNAIKLRYPIVVTKLISLLSHRILGSMQSRPNGLAAPLEANPVTHKYSTVALVPVSEDVPLTAFTFELYHSLAAIGPTLRLTSEFVRKQLNIQYFEASNEYRTTSWLAQQEDCNIITLYQCDASLSIWTQRCMRQADVILLVGLGDHSPNVGKFEREIDRLAMRTQKELVLLYPENSSLKPTNTLQWLNMRPWVTKHHHIQCAKRMFTRKSQHRINDLYSRVLMSEPNMHSDFSRLARWLTGNSIGLVLGGGGARGAAHIGMLKAIQEAGIPVDMVGGVSIGALMGALWCSERNITTVTQKAREWCKKMTKWFLQLLDLTYPITSMFSGREFNKTIRDTFGDVSIEDLWIPYFTLTTDITASCHRIHTNGSLWRFVRSSMSLSGYMPPLCDPKDGHLLLDGGYVNNLPADVMRNLGAAHIIAIDVGSQDDTDLTNYGDDLSGWWLLYKKWNPFTNPVKVPDLPDIQSRLAYVSCVRQLEEVKNSDYCEYVRPPIDKYKTLAFGSFDEIRDVGYVFGKNHFDLMAKAGRLGRFNQWFSKLPPHKDNNASLSEYSFIDLAQIVCKLPETLIDHNQHPQHYFYSEDEDFDGYISEPSTYNRHRHIKINRAGTSLSLSENEMDSDVEVDLSLAIRRHNHHTHHHQQRSRGSQSPHTPPSESQYITFGPVENIDSHEINTVDLDDTLSRDVVEEVEELPLDNSKPSTEKELPLANSKSNTAGELPLTNSKSNTEEELPLDNSKSNTEEETETSSNKTPS